MVLYFSFTLFLHFSYFVYDSYVTIESNIAKAKISREYIAIYNFTNRHDMANKTMPNDVLSLREVLNMEIIVNQALIDPLVFKGVIT